METTTREKFYNDLLKLTKKSLIVILKTEIPHLKNSFYKASKRDIIGELKKRRIFG